MAYRPQAATLRPGAAPLPSRYYTSSEVLAEEMDAVFGDQWVCIGRSAEVAAPATYVTAVVGDEPVVVVRRDDGSLIGVSNVCRHRGSLLCRQRSGVVSRVIRCPFHAWTYDLDGTLISAPFMDDVEGFAPGDVALPSFPTAEWEGFVFVHLGPAPPPFSEAWRDVLGHFARWGVAGLSSVARRDYVVQANWKLVVENYSECYHCPSIHPRFSLRCPSRSGRNDRYTGPFLGGFMDLNDPYPTLSIGGGPCAPALPGLGALDLRRVYFYALFPNLLLSLHPDYVVAYTLWPQAPDRTLVRCEWLFAGAEGRAGADGAAPWDPDGAVAFWDEANREDFESLAFLQQGMRSRRFRPAPYSPLESLAAAFDDHVLAVLGHDG